MGNVSNTSIEPRYQSGFCGIQGRRPTMEDALCIHDVFGGNDKMSFFGLFDGHNGSRCAEFISQRLPKNLLKDPDFKDHPELALTSSFVLTNDQWFETQSSQQDGSCALAALIRRDCIYVANVGDSRAIISQGTQVLPLSKDHKATDLEEVQMIEKLGGKVIGGRVESVLAVSRAFGNLNYKERISCLPDVKLWTITEDTEFIVLACDGVWDVMNNEEVGLFVRKQLLDETTPEDVATNLALHCLQRRSLDNISVIIVSFLTAEKRLSLQQNLFQGGPPPVPFVQTPVPTTDPYPLRSQDTETPPPFKRRRSRRLSDQKKP